MGSNFIPRKALTKGHQEKNIAKLGDTNWTVERNLLGHVVRAQATLLMYLTLVSAVWRTSFFDEH